MRRPKTEGRFHVPALGRRFPELGVAVSYAQGRVCAEIVERLSIVDATTGQVVARVERQPDKSVVTRSVS